MKRIILFACLLAFFMPAVFAQHPINNLVPGQWLQSWLVCGPIPLQDHSSPEQLLLH